MTRAAGSRPTYSGGSTARRTCISASWQSGSSGSGPSTRHDAIIVCGPVEATSEFTGELGPWAAEHVAAVHSDIRGLEADDIRDLVEGSARRT